MGIKTRCSTCEDTAA